MTKDYPLRPRNYILGRYEEVCECGHGADAHNSESLSTLGMFPTYRHNECRVCMCPAYIHEKTLKECLDCNGQ